jgi:hypothetical protein
MEKRSLQHTSPERKRKPDCAKIREWMNALQIRNEVLNDQNGLSILFLEELRARPAEYLLAESQTQCNRVCARDGAEAESMAKPVKRVSKWQPKLMC